ncbi:DUF4286 family protein [Novosphingobium pentaromativorans]|nr:DUF4286 family protein [Novosphingobium pentaromativorans]
MARYMILALNGPTQGDAAEAAFNRWYDETHLPELRAVEGIVSARRFRTLHGNTPYPYFAAYEVETDDLDAFMKTMMTSMGPFPPEFDKANSGNIVAMEITPD